MNDSVNQPRSFEVFTAEPVRRRRKPRDWSDNDKARIVAAALQRGANVSAVVRSEGLDPSQLYGWRRKALASGVVAPLTARTGKEIKFARPPHRSRRDCWLEADDFYIGPPIRRQREAVVGVTERLE
ncbi:transposase [Rhizobium leguminosarum bv. viciae]|uniref:transposase n=1 Tax=Rhizobium leguminosarum TaxID=384 RepID=UPI00103C477C|nr:transposase [Rhizobium leguminosarum]TCA41408.1 transposase [Rhizobium leguminosarum bv. viciae]